jgi:pimeloyl-ACP methyl ester carboxylesterase
VYLKTNFAMSSPMTPTSAMVGWSWGAMMGGYYASLHSESVQKLVMYAPLYDFNDHTNLGPGSGLQNKRKPTEFNFALGVRIALRRRRPTRRAATVQRVQHRGRSRRVKPTCIGLDREEFGTTSCSNL